jgi:methionyl-tRNA formyltransferase
VTQPDRPRGRGYRVSAPPIKVLAQKHGIPVLQPARLKDVEFLAAVRSTTPDLGVVAAYGKILPDAVLGVPRLGMINVHASLLPAWRGAAPVHRAVMAGESETGVTIMRVVQELDAGPMLAQRSRPIGPDETSDDVERDLAALGGSLLPGVIAAMEAGTVSETPQDHSKANYAPRLVKEDGLVDWSRGAAAIHNQVRGLHPWPLASAWIHETRLLVRRTHALDRSSGTPGLHVPGIIVETRGRLVVACGEGTQIEILELQPEGRRAMSAREFLAGHHIEPGARFHTPES